jgi:hypothetical protein
MPTVRLLNSSGREQIPLKLISVQLQLKKWSDDLKIYNLCRRIEQTMKTPAFTNRNDALYIIQVHSNDVTNAMWQELTDLDGVEIFVTDVRKL